MEEIIKPIGQKFFNWVIGSVWGVIGFIIAWITRNTLRANKLNELMAANMEGDRKRDEAIRDLKGDIAAQRKEFDELKNAIMKWRTETNTLATRVNKVLEQLGE